MEPTYTAAQIRDCIVSVSPDDTSRSIALLLLPPAMSRDQAEAAVTAAVKAAHVATDNGDDGDLWAVWSEHLADAGITLLGAADSARSFPRLDVAPWDAATYVRPEFVVCTGWSHFVFGKSSINTRFVMRPDPNQGDTLVCAQFEGDDGCWFDLAPEIADDLLESLKDEDVSERPSDWDMTLTNELPEWSRTVEALVDRPTSRG